MQSFSKFLVILLVMLLSACKASSDDQYHYLMQHPYALRAMIADCQLLDTQQEKIAKHCDVAMKAGNDLMTLIEIQQKNPEKFGMNILLAQMSLAAANEILAKQIEEYTSLQKSDASASTLEAARQEMASSKQKVTQIKNDVDTRLAVVGLSSPE